MSMPQLCFVDLTGLRFNFYALVTAFSINYGTVPLPHCMSSLGWEMSQKRMQWTLHIFGFSFIPKCEGTQKAQCFLCGQFLASEMMKPAKLKEHLTSVDPETRSDSVDLFCKNKLDFKGWNFTKLGFSQTQILVNTYSFATLFKKESSTHHKSLFSTSACIDVTLPMILKEALSTAAEKLGAL